MNNVRGVRAPFLLVLLGAVALFAGCATSTAPGAVGVNRSQLMVMSSDVINAQAVQGFSKLTSAAATAGRLNTDAEMTRRVKDISARLIAQVRVFRPEAASWDWQVNVIDSEQVNAFCMPGGKIAVFSGLIKKLDLTDTELAAVLGHEIAHALREHSREKASQRLLSDAVVQGIAASRSRNAPIHASVAQLGSLFFVQLPYSREMEVEADVMGLELMARAGYDPKLASNVWLKMQKLEGGGGRLEFFSTHPNHEHRIAAMDAALPKVASLYAGSTAPATVGASQPPALASVQPMPAAAPDAGKAPAVVVPATASAFTSTSAVPASRRGGTESFQIEQMGRQNKCDPNARAWLTAKETGFELYWYQCNAQETWNLRCEFRQCRIVN